jgi:hypothetical protein
MIVFPCSVITHATFIIFTVAGNAPAVQSVVRFQTIAVTPDVTLTRFAHFVQGFLLNPADRAVQWTLREWREIWSWYTQRCHIRPKV